MGIPHVSSGEAGERKLYISKDFVLGAGREDVVVFRMGEFVVFFLDDLVTRTSGKNNGSVN